jgi:hypothetical protein
MKERQQCMIARRGNLKGSRKQTAENEEGVERVGRGSKFILLEG